MTPPLDRPRPAPSPSPGPKSHFDDPTGGERTKLYMMRYFVQSAPSTALAPPGPAGLPTPSNLDSVSAQYGVLRARNPNDALQVAIQHLTFLRQTTRQKHQLYTVEVKELEPFNPSARGIVPISPRGAMTQDLAV